MIILTINGKTDEKCCQASGIASLKEVFVLRKIGNQSKKRSTFLSLKIVPVALVE